MVFSVLRLLLLLAAILSPNLWAQAASSFSLDHLRSTIRDDLHNELNGVIESYMLARFGKPGAARFDIRISLQDEDSKPYIDAVFVTAEVEPPAHDPLLYEELVRVSRTKLRQLGYRPHQDAEFLYQHDPVAFLTLNIQAPVFQLQDRVVGIFGKVAVASGCLMLLFLFHLLRVPKKTEEPGPPARPAEPFVARDPIVPVTFSPDQGTWCLSAIDSLNTDALVKTFTTLPWQEAVMIIGFLPKWKRAELLDRLKLVPALRPVVLNAAKDLKPY